MLFRNIQGKLIEINRYDYKNDSIYYTKIMELINQKNKNLAPPFSKVET